MKRQLPFIAFLALILGVTGLLESRGSFSSSRGSFGRQDNRGSRNVGGSRSARTLGGERSGHSYRHVTPDGRIERRTVDSSHRRYASDRRLNYQRGTKVRADGSSSRYGRHRYEHDQRNSRNIQQTGKPATQQPRPTAPGQPTHTGIGQQTAAVPAQQPQAAPSAAPTRPTISNTPPATPMPQTQPTRPAPAQPQVAPPINPSPAVKPTTQATGNVPAETSKGHVSDNMDSVKKTSKRKIK